MNEKENTVVLIDGEYLKKIFYHFKKKNPYLKCHINKIAINLSKTKNLWCKKIYYYNAPPYQGNPPTEDEKRRKKQYDEYQEILKKIKPEVVVKEGRCQKKEEGHYGQKGVDAQLIMDLVDIKEMENVEKIILLACDTDFVPPIQKIQEKKNVKVILAYFFKKERKDHFSMSNHIMSICKEKILINKEHFEMPNLNVNKTLRNLYPNYKK